MLANKLYYSGTLTWSTRCGPSECRLLYWVLAWDLDTAVCPMSGLWGQCLGRLKSSKKITVSMIYIIFIQSKCIEIQTEVNSLGNDLAVHLLVVRTWVTFRPPELNVIDWFNNDCPTKRTSTVILDVTLEDFALFLHPGDLFVGPRED